MDIGREDVVALATVLVTFFETVFVAAFDEDEEEKTSLIDFLLFILELDFLLENFHVLSLSMRLEKVGLIIGLKGGEVVTLLLLLLPFDNLDLLSLLCIFPLLIWMASLASLRLTIYLQGKEFSSFELFEFK